MTIAPPPLEEVGTAGMIVKELPPALDMVVMSAVVPPVKENTFVTAKLVEVAAVVVESPMERKA
jgi:hypothetical protein